MKQYTESFTVLEMFGPTNTVWHRPIGTLFRPAELLAYQGRWVEAIETAEKIYIKNYGNMHGVSFRCVTTSKTITICAGDWSTAGGVELP